MTDIEEPDDGTFVLTSETVYQRDDVNGFLGDNGAEERWFELPSAQVHTWDEIVTYARKHKRTIRVLEPGEWLL